MNPKIRIQENLWCYVGLHMEKVFSDLPSSVKKVYDDDSGDTERKEHCDAPHNNLSNKGYYSETCL